MGRAGGAQEIRHARRRGEREKEKFQQRLERSTIHED